jgi:hypothetical protein
MIGPGATAQTMHVATPANRPMRPFRRLLAVAGGCVLSGCGSLSQPPPPKPFVAPSVRAEVNHYAGSALSGPTPRAVPSVPPDQAVGVRVRMVALERLPAGRGELLAATARLVTADRLGTPVLPAAQLTRFARLVELPDARQFEEQVVRPSGGRAAELRPDATAAVARGVTAAVVLTDPAPLRPQVTGAGGSRLVELDVSRPGDALAAPPDPPPAAGAVPVELALVVQDVEPLPAEEDRAAEDAAGPGKPGAAKPAVAAKPRPATLQRETVVLTRQVAATDTVCILLPFAFVGSDAQGVAIVVELTRGPGSPEHQAAISEAVEGGRRSADAVSRRPTTLPVGSPAGGGGADAVGLAAAVSGLSAAAGGGGGGSEPAGPPGTRLRAPLVYLAGQAKSPLCEDVALVADDATLVTLAARVTAAVDLPPSDGSSAATPPVAATGPSAGPAPAPPRAFDPEAASWAIDKATFVLLGERVADGTLPPELAAVVAAHAGEAGRHPSSFEEVGRAATGRRDFDARLLAENLIYLEDSSPSARVRALDWLRARGRAPAGFDPFDEPRDRRAALDRAAAGTNTQ